MNNLNQMSFFDHLDELRSRIIKCILSVFLFAIITYSQSDRIIDILIDQVRNQSVNFQVLKITSIFLIKIGISIITGIIISFPIIIYQALRFILPAFHKLTSKKIILFTSLSVILFFVGLLFGYEVIIPFSMDFFYRLSIGITYVNLNYTLENYLFYLIWILIISSMIFQLPFLIVLIVKTGILKVEDFKQYRKHIIVFFFILAALLTPPDPISQIFIVIPLYLLFEFSLILTKIFKDNE